MPTPFQIWQIFIRTFLPLILIYTALRIGFIALFSSDLEIHSIKEILNIIISGWRFDLSALMLANIVFYGIFFLVFPWTAGLTAIWRVWRVLFIAWNLLFILLNLADFAYFPFVQKRMQMDAMQFLTGEKGSDFYRLLPEFILQFWYIPFLVILAYIFLNRLIPFSIFKAEILRNKNTKSIFQSLFSLSIFGALSIIAIRGGFQLKPIDSVNAGQMTDSRKIPAVVNTTFTLLRSRGKNNLTEDLSGKWNYQAELQKKIIQPFKRDSFKSWNVVILIVESLSHKYLHNDQKWNATPFLDSLLNEGLYMENSYANAKESIQGIPAILSSIPSLQKDPYINSIYSTNQISSLPNELKNKSYTTGFFHGGQNGTMRLDLFAKMAGIEKYFGKNEYNNDSDFDGKWGIWDHKFLSRVVDELNLSPEPFVYSIFTMNPHHPFQIPEEFAKEMQVQKEPLINCLRYTDYALRTFFERAKKQKWYDNTLFVITADHTGKNVDDVYRVMTDIFKIPILFFKPKDISPLKDSTTIVNQIDIFPSVLALLNYDRAFFSYGRNVFDTTGKNYCINLSYGLYQYVDSDYIVLHDGQKIVEIYDQKKDIYNTTNLVNTLDPLIIKKYNDLILLETNCFSHSLIHNMMVSSKINK